MATTAQLFELSYLSRKLNLKIDELIQRDRQSATHQLPPGEVSSYHQQSAPHPLPPGEVSSYHQHSAPHPQRSAPTFSHHRHSAPSTRGSNPNFLIPIAPSQLAPTPVAVPNSSANTTCLFMDVIDAKNILNVKVLFLNNISLGNLCPIYQEPWDFLSSRFFEFCFSNGTNFMDFPDLTLAEALRVPDNLTTNYLGESISLFVKIQNDCPNTNIYGLHFNIELHSPKYNNNLLVDGPFDCLSSSSSIHRILYHEINDLGNHTLVVTINYSKNDENIKFVRSYSFEVYKPIDIKTKYVSPENFDFCILESRIHNISNQILFLNSLSLKSLSKYAVSPLNCSSSSDSEVTFGEIQAKETISYLFKISPLEFNLTPSDLGKLDISWRNTFIQKGRLQTGNLDKPVKSIQNLRIHILNVPSIVYCNRPFDIQIAVNNLTNNNLNTHVILQSIPLIFYWCGKSKFILSHLSQNNPRILYLKGIAFIPGHHNIGSIIMRDLDLNTEYKFSYLKNILVLQ